MAKYMFTARYTAEGAKGLVRDGGTGRRAAVEKGLRRGRRVASNRCISRSAASTRT